jgi:hypothetical protein
MPSRYTFEEEGSNKIHAGFSQYRRHCFSSSLTRIRYPKIEGFYIKDRYLIPTKSYRDNVVCIFNINTLYGFIFQRPT